ncbi:MAG: cytochrome C [Desulfobulbus sp.]|nr:MAG: cytochrome C [Desulfobulbus sp.]
MMKSCLFNNSCFLQLLAVLVFGAGCSVQALASEEGMQLSSEKPARPVVEECMRCHDVKMYQTELKSSVHAFDKDKKVISCEQCHTFHFDSLTSYYARDEYYDKKIFPPGAFDRRKLQANARKAIRAEKCQACHKDLYKNIKDEPISEIGRLCHDAFLGKNGETRRTCAGCHINIAHLPEFDRSMPMNADFASRLKKNAAAGADKGGAKK